MAELNTLAAVRTVVNSANPTDVQIRQAFEALYNALTRGVLVPWITLDSAGAPTDAIVQSADVGGITEREVYDNMVVGVRSGAKLQLYQRVAGAWLAVDDA